MGSEPADSTDHCETTATIEAQRRQLFKASAVVAVCRNACASMYEEIDPEQLANALLVVDDLIDGVAGVLEKLADNEPAHREDEHDHAIEAPS